MQLAMPLAAHLFMSLIMFSIPYLTRREILFGVVLPSGFRSRPDGRRAVPAFRLAVAIPSLSGLVAIAMLGSRFIAFAILAPMITILSGFSAFVMQNRKLKAFALRPQAIRELELSDEPERLPWFAWLGLAPLLFLAATALYLDAHWDSIPASRPTHWRL